MPRNGDPPSSGATAAGPLEVLRGRDGSLLLLVTAAAAILALPTLAGIGMLDEGALVHVADRIAGGEVLYRDVATGIMPGSYYLHALLFLVFGRSLLVGRVLMILLFTGATAGMFVILRRSTCRTAAAAAALCFAALTVHYWRYPNYSPQAMVLILGMLGAASVYLRTGRERALWAAAGLLGLALVFKQNYGAFASLGLAAGLMAAQVPWRRRVRDVAVAAGIAAVPLIGTVALLASAGALDSFWRYTVLVPLGVPTTVFARPYPPLWRIADDRLWRDLLQYLPFEELFSEFPAWVFTHTGWSMAIVRITYYLPPLLLLAAGMTWLLRRRPDRAEGALFLATAGLLFLGVFPRVDAHHLVLILVPWFLAMGWWTGSRPRGASVGIWVAAASVLLVVSAAAQTARILDREPHGVRDAWLGHPRARVWVPRGAVPAIERTLRDVQERVPASEPIFVGPAAPMYYFLTGHPSPTRFPLILPGAMDEEELIRDLGSVRWALLTDGAFEDYTFENVAPAVWDHLRREFRLADAGAGDGTPLPPYLCQRGPPPPPPQRQLVVGPDGPGIVPPVGPRSTASLMRPSLSEPPPYQVVSRNPWTDPQRRRVSWGIEYLRPALIATAPWGWRKLLVSFEVPSAPGRRFEFACALDPEAWGTDGIEGQGAIAEVWISAPGHPPRRAWRRWLDPRRREEDRRWTGAAIDLASFVDGPVAEVTLVSGPSPGFDGTDAKIAWTDLGLSAPDADAAVEPARAVRLGPGRARRILSFQEEDLPIFIEAAGAYAGSAPAQAALGEVAASLGVSAQALAACRRAVDLEPENATYRVRLAEALERSGQTAEAGREMREAARLARRDPNVHAALAAFLERSGDAAGARRAARDALSLDAGNAWALTTLARVELSLGDAAAAVEAGRRAAAADPRNPRAWLDLSAALAANGDPDAAREALESAADLDLDAGARAVVARRFLRMGDVARALEEAVTATAADPSSIPAWASRAAAAAAAGDREASLRAWTEAESIAPDRFDVLLPLAHARRAVGDREGAAAALERAAAAAGDDPRRVAGLARAYATMGRAHPAADAWERVLALAPGGELEAEARRELRRLRPIRE